MFLTWSFVRTGTQPFWMFSNSATQWRATSCGGPAEVTQGVEGTPNVLDLVLRENRYPTFLDVQQFSDAMARNIMRGAGRSRVVLSSKNIKERRLVVVWRRRTEN